MREIRILIDFVYQRADIVKSEFTKESVNLKAQSVVSEDTQSEFLFLFMFYKNTFFLDLFQCRVDSLTDT